MLCVGVRSADVLQIRSSPVSDRMNLSLCTEDRLTLDKWLIVDRAHVGRDPQACPLQGGYVLGMFDKVSQPPRCVGWSSEDRPEEYNTKLVQCLLSYWYFSYY